MGGNSTTHNISSCTEWQHVAKGAEQKGRIRQLLFSCSESRDRSQRDQRSKSLIRSQPVHLGPLPLINGQFKGLKRATFMSSKSFHLSGLPENVWSSPFVMIHFGYPACRIQSLMAARVFSGLTGMLLRESRSFALKVASAWCWDPFNSSCWVSAVPLPHSQQPPCFFLERVLIKELKADPMYTQILRADIKWLQKKRIYVRTWNAILSVFNWVQKSSSSAFTKSKYKPKEEDNKVETCMFFASAHYEQSVECFLWKPFLYVREINNGVCKVILQQFSSSLKTEVVKSEI